MAHGFRWIPEVRTAQAREGHYSCCGALAGLGNDDPHFCKERTPGTWTIPVTGWYEFTSGRPPERMQS